MDIADIQKSTGGIDAIASQLGIDKATAQAGAGALLPAIVGGMKKQNHGAGASGDGLGGLGAILGSLGGAGLAANVLSDGPTDVSKGNDVLGTIFGSKDVSRTVAEHAAGQTGIDPAILRKMLPILAMLVGGYFAHEKGIGGGNASSGGGLGGLGSILGSVFGGGAKGGSQAGGLGGLASMLDMDGDGNPLDDILGMAGKFLR
jgi:hypothetical protein